MVKINEASQKAFSDDVCADCGAVVKGGTAGCRSLMHQVSVRAYSDPAYFGVHRPAVDAYALQHPEPYCHSAKSLAAHLTGLCCALEHEGHSAVYKALQRWLNGTPELERPEPPAFRGKITIADVCGAVTVDEHARTVHEWASCVWDAWSAHHHTARRWVRSAVGATDE